MRALSIKLSIKQGNGKVLSGIAFQKGDQLERIKSKEPFHIVYKLEENHWQEKTYLQLNVKDIR